MISDYFTTRTKYTYTQTSEGQLLQRILKSNCILELVVGIFIASEFNRCQSELISLVSIFYHISNWLNILLIPPMPILIALVLTITRVTCQEYSLAQYFFFFFDLTLFQLFLTTFKNKGTHATLNLKIFWPISESNFRQRLSLV